MCGSPTMDLTELKKVVVYDGYKPTDQTIVFFWEVYVLQFIWKKRHKFFSFLAYFLALRKKIVFVQLFNMRVNRRSF